MRIWNDGSGAAALYIGQTGTGSAIMYMDASNGDFSGSDYCSIAQNNDLTLNIESAANAGNITLKSKGTLAQTIDGANTTFAGNLYGSGTGNYLYFNYLRGHGADNMHIDPSSGWNIYLSYYVARDIRGASGNTLHSQSDERLKDNVVTLSNSLDKLSAIRGIHYKWKEDTNQAEGLVDDDGNRRLMTGVLAQEVETQFPELVSEGMARIKDEDAEDGWRDEEGYKYVAYDGFIPHLIEAVKELSSENDDLKSRITALENA